MNIGVECEKIDQDLPNHSGDASRNKSLKRRGYVKDDEKAVLAVGGGETAIRLGTAGRERVGIAVSEQEIRAVKAGRSKRLDIRDLP